MEDSELLWCGPGGRFCRNLTEEVAINYGAAQEETMEVCADGFRDAGEQAVAIACGLPGRYDEITGGSDA